jgi:hypothetical protein
MGTDDSDPVDDLDAIADAVYDRLYLIKVGLTVLVVVLCYLADASVLPWVAGCLGGIALLGLLDWLAGLVRPWPKPRRPIVAMSSRPYRATQARSLHQRRQPEPGPVGPGPAVEVLRDGMRRRGI